MKTDRSCGIIPVLQRNNGRRYLLVQHRRGHWGFPKGHPEPGETAVETARRELEEEAGVTDVRVLEEPVFVETYTFTKRSGKQVRKTVVYFVGLVHNENVRPCPGEIRDCAWGNAAQTRDRLRFAEARRLLDEAEAYLNSTSLESSNAEP